MVPPPKARFPLTMRSAGGSLRRASWWSLRRTALRSLGRCGRPKIFCASQLETDCLHVYIHHHPTSSNIIQHHPSSSNIIILSLALSSAQVCFVPKRQTYIHPWALQLANPSHRQSLLLDTSFFRRWAKAAMFATRL